MKTLPCPSLVNPLRIECTAIPAGRIPHQNFPTMRAASWWDIKEGSQGYTLLLIRWFLLNQTLQMENITQPESQTAHRPEGIFAEYI